VDLAALAPLAPAALVVTGEEERIVVLSEPDAGGDRRLLVERADKDEGDFDVHSTRRDRIVRGPGHSVLLAGGGLPGVDVLMVP
jgi:hypothetical protein